MIHINRNATPPKSLAIEKTKKNGSYNKQDVYKMLYEDFFEKCYICGVKPIQDGGEIEHLLAHKGDIDLKFDWNNLFLSCSHCNGTKNKAEYSEKIINCTKVDPSDFILHRFIDNSVHISCKKDRLMQETAKLIAECFNGERTFKKGKAASVRLNELKKEMTIFSKLTLNYANAQNNHYKKQIIAHLQPSSKFTAFKRDYIADISSLADIFKHTY